MKMKLCGILLLAIVLQSCGTVSKTIAKNATTTKGIGGKYWVLETLNGTKVQNEKISKNLIGFEINTNNKSISGFSGCNRFMGKVAKLTTNSLTFSPLASTKMACPQSSFNEYEFLKIFEGVTTYKLKQEKLYLVDSKGDVAVFHSKNKINIAEKYWKLIQLNGEKITMSPHQEREAYIMLKNDSNKVKGFTGCNQFFGKYSLHGTNKVSFSTIAATLKASTDSDFDEQKFLKMLTSVDHYSVDLKHLQLFDKKGKSLAVFEVIYF